MRRHRDLLQQSGILGGSRLEVEASFEVILADRVARRCASWRAVWRKAPRRFASTSEGSEESVVHRDSLAHGVVGGGLRVLGAWRRWR